jgi:hypothetical protein
VTGSRRVVLAVAALSALAALLLVRSCEGPIVDPPPYADAAAPSAPRKDGAPVAAPRARARPSDAPAADPAATLPAADGPSTSGAPQEPPVTKLRIHGRVREESGKGVAGAEFEIRAWSGNEPDVQWFSLTGKADDNGTFDVSIDAARASIGFGIETSADGHLEGWVHVKRAEYDEAKGVDVVVERGRAIVGRVIDGEGRPIARTTVQLWYGSETTWPTTVGEDGRFRTPSRAPLRAFDLVVEAPGHSRRSVPIVAADAEETDVGDIVFRSGGRIAGVVVDRAGRPVPDLQLTFERIAGKEGRVPRCRTDSEGRFEFTDVGEDPATVYVDINDPLGGPAGARLRYRGFVNDVAPGRTDVRIVAAAWTTIRLMFVDALTGKPVDVKKAEYGLRYEGTPEPERLGQGASGSDPLVSTVMSAECGRRYDLTVRCPGFDVARVNGIEVGDVAELEVRVPMRRSP